MSTVPDIPSIPQSFPENPPRDYRFGFNGMEGDDEVRGAGNSYTTEFRQYDPRIGRWLSIDPKFRHFPWQSPYVAFDNNPILKVDPQGDAAYENNKPSRIERKFDRKFERWKQNNQSAIAGSDPHEILNAFATSTNLFGQQRGNSNWFEKYMGRTDLSGATGWKPTTRGPTTISMVPGTGAGRGSLNQTTDIGTQTGTMRINYNMRSIPDRLQVVNPATGAILFDTVSLPSSDGRGRVRRRQGSGQTINFDLGTGNSNVQVLINGGTGTNATNFSYRIRVEPPFVQISDGQIIRNDTE